MGVGGGVGVGLQRDFRGDFKQDMEGYLMSSSGQVRFRSNFNSFELDSEAEVGRLVIDNKRHLEGRRKEVFRPSRNLNAAKSRKSSLLRPIHPDQESGLSQHTVAEVFRSKI